MNQREHILYHLHDLGTTFNQVMRVLAGRTVKEYLREKLDRKVYAGCEIGHGFKGCDYIILFVDHIYFRIWVHGNPELQGVLEVIQHEVMQEEKPHPCWLKGVNDTTMWGWKFFGLRRVRWTDGQNSWLLYWRKRTYILWG